MLCIQYLINQYYTNIELTSNVLPFYHRQFLPCTQPASPTEIQDLCVIWQR